MRSALLLTAMVIAESIYMLKLGDSRDNPQSKEITIVVGIFLLVFFCMDIYELFFKIK